jgi:PAS domain S-box-containing protein
MRREPRPEPEPQPATDVAAEMAEAITDALRRGEVDAVVSQSTVLMLRVHEAEAALRASEARLRLALEAAQMGTWEWQPGGAFIGTAATEALLGLAPGAFAGTEAAFLACVHPDDRARVREAAAHAAGAGGEAAFECRVHWPDGSLHWLALRGRPLDVPAGPAARLVGVMMDVTPRQEHEAQLRASLREKEVLLQEVHHRVKNNLQVVASLLSLQADALQAPEARLALQDCQARVYAMALTHEVLYQSPDLARVDLADYARRLAAHLLPAAGVEPGRIQVALEAEPLWLGAEQAVPCGLILSELLTNCVKHAFPGGRAGAITVTLAAVGGARVRLRVRDDGVGVPPGLDVRAAESFGWQLLQLLTEQLQGTLELTRDGGTTVTVEFPR